MTTANAKEKVLVIGYGNPTRRDDRVGWYVIEQLEGKVPDNVVLDTVHQLEIEQVDLIQDYDLVIFVDAHVSEIDDWKCRTELEALYEVGAISHHFTPGSLLSLCQFLHKKAPRGILYSIKGIDFNFGEEFSPQTKQAADETVGEIIAYLNAK